MQLLAVLIGVVPFYAFIIWSHLTKESPYSLQDLFLYPIVVGSLGIVWMVFLYTTLCGERLSSLNLRPGRWSRDLVMGILLTLVLFTWGPTEKIAIAHWIPRQSPPPEILNLIMGLAESPLLLALWLGPVVWIGVAVFEELSRVFILNRLWCVWDHPVAQWGVLVFSAALFGFAHIYQGPQGAVSVGVIGVIFGIAYRMCGRVWPLIIAHALFDSIQIAWVVTQIRSGALQ
jgi:membrane protease YdiL (CAAX protease family)